MNQSTLSSINIALLTGVFRAWLLTVSWPDILQQRKHSPCSPPEPLTSSGGGCKIQELNLWGAMGQHTAALPQVNGHKPLRSLTDEGGTRFSSWVEQL